MTVVGPHFGSPTICTKRTLYVFVLSTSDSTSTSILSAFPLPLSILFLAGSYSSSKSPVGGGGLGVGCARDVRDFPELLRSLPLLPLDGLELDLGLRARDLLSVGGGGGVVEAGAAVGPVASSMARKLISRGGLTLAGDDKHFA